jgi:hypothetical protein
MSFHLHFFADDATRAEELASDGPLLTMSIKQYFASLKEKYEAIDSLRLGAPLENVLRLVKRPLADELALISGSERKAEEIVRDLEVTSHHQRLKDLEYLRLTLDHTASQERYAYQLVRQLHTLLVEEAHTVRALEKTFDNPALRQALIDAVEREARIAGELRKMKNFDELYKSLALGARRKHELDDQEWRIAEDIFNRMNDTQTAEGCRLEPTAQHDTAELTAHCFNNLDIVAMNAAANGLIGQHPHALFEYVNSDFFEQFVKREARNSFPRISNAELRVFIYIFREFYNTRIEQDMY